MVVRPGRLSRAGKLSPQYLLVTRGKPVLRELADPTKLDVVLLGEMGLIALTDRDLARLKRFVDQGGRLVVTADAFFVGTVPQANKVLGPYGLEMTNTERGGATFELLLDPKPFAASTATV